MHCERSRTAANRNAVDDPTMTACVCDVETCRVLRSEPLFPILHCGSFPITGLLPAVLSCGHDHVKDQFEIAVQNHLAAKAFRAGGAAVAQSQDNVATDGLMAERASEVQ